MVKKPKSSDRSGQVRISRIATFANWCITTVTAIIALGFVGLALKDIPITALSNANPEIIQVAILSVYISCWAYGTSMDTKIQGGIYADDPEGGRVRTGSVVAVAFLAVISVILLSVRSNELYFALALAAFTTIDVLGWLYLRYWLLPPIIKASRDKFENEDDYYGQIILNKVASQIIGDWKWRRQIPLTLIVLSMVLIAVFPRLHEIVAENVHRLVPALPSETIRLLLQDFLLLAFVLVSELWHFALRLNTFLTIRVLNEMEEKFTLEPAIGRQRPPKARGRRRRPSG
jgi:hypothetical protein